MGFNINKQLVDNKVSQIMKQELEIFKNSDENKKKSLAFLVYGISSFLDVDIETASQCITDGGNDGGFDGAYYEVGENNELNVFLFQSKYKRDLENDSHFSANAIEKSINTVKTIFDIKKQINLNPLSKAVVDEIRSFIFDGYIPKITFVMIFNGSKWNADGDNYIKNFGQEEQVSFLLYNHDNIIEQENSQKEIVTNLQLSGKANKDDYNYKSVIIGKMSVVEIYRLVESYKDSLLEKNVRKYLGNSSVNKNIADTLLDNDKKSNFFFFNNGITFTCDKMSANYLQEADWNVRVNNLQIINGGQTCRTIYKTISENFSESYNGADVLVRIYEVDGDTELLEDITYATNNQNPIELRDLKANDFIQKTLMQGAELLGYEYKPKRDDKSGGIPSQVAAEAVLTIWRENPTTAKSKKGDLFTFYYDEIFKELNASQLIIAVKIFRFADSMRKKTSQDINIDTSRRFSNYLIAMVMGNELLKEFSIKLKDLTHTNFEEIDKWLSLNIQVLYTNSENIVLTLVEKQLGAMYVIPIEIHEVDGRTLASIYRNQMMVTMYKNQ